MRLLHEALEPPYYKMGSPQNLQVTLIPEFEAAMHVVRNWNIAWLYTVHPSPGDFSPGFITSLLRIMSLGVAFDRDTLGEHLPRSRAYGAYRPPSLVRGKGEYAAYVVHDMGRLLLNNHPASLPSGILFVKCVYTNTLEHR